MSSQGKGGPPGHFQVTDVVRRARAATANALERSCLTGGRTVVAVSGGQDSLALLDALRFLKEGLDLELTCAHFDHGLRGRESAADARFVLQHCEETGIECVLGCAGDGPEVTSEESARQARYGFLAGVAAQVGAHAVLVGHSATDQAETVLLNLLRGSGLPGLSAMRQDSVLRLDSGKKLRIVRPLLTVSRSDLGQYCVDIGIRPRMDLTNESREFTRNRIRHELLPMLHTFNPAVEGSIVRLSELALRAEEFVEAETDRLWASYVVERDHSVAITRAAASLPPAVVGSIARRAIRRIKGDLKDVRQSHIDDVAGLLGGSRGRSICLPGGFVAAACGEEVVVGSRAVSRRASPEASMPLPVPGCASWSGWEVSAAIESGEGTLGGQDETGLAASLDPVLAEGPIWVRGWIEGDRMQPLGMDGTKKLRRLFAEARVPRQERRRVPLVVTGEGIAWVAGCRIAEWAKAPPGAGSSLRVSATPTTSPGSGGD